MLRKTKHASRASANSSLTKVDDITKKEHRLDNSTQNGYDLSEICCC